MSGLRQEFRMNDRISALRKMSPLRRQSMRAFQIMTAEQRLRWLAEEQGYYWKTHPEFRARRRRMALAAARLERQAQVKGKR